jgi:hypothetical protein
MNAVTYDDLTHIYSCDGVRYLSSTQIVEMFRRKFDAATAAQIQEDKSGRPAEEFIRIWKDINLKSLDRGNIIHDLRDEITNNRAFEVIYGKPFRVQNPQLFPTRDMSQWPDGVYTDNKQDVLYRHDYRIAGRPDRYTIVTEDGIRYVHIDDYKTNRRLRTRSYCDPVQGYQMMLEPISHLMDCEMVHYTLQLSLYMFMFEYQGFKPGRMRLIHFPHIPEIAPPGAKEPDPVEYPIEYDRDSVVLMLDHLKRKRIV